MSGFGTVSPQAGQLDVGAFEELLEDDLDRGASLLAALVGASDPVLAAAARRIAGRLLIDVARGGRGAGGRRRPVHATGWLGGELALERSLEPLLLARATGHPVDPAVLTERRRRTPRSAVCLVVDHSGSMEDRRLATAGLAAAAVTVRVAPDQRVVLGFARQTQVIATPSTGVDAATTVERILRLRGHGATDLATALREAHRHLARIPARRRAVVLLSDARSTVGEDPTAAARAIDDLRILVPTDDTEAAIDLARAGGGTFEPVDGPADVPRALAALLRR